MICNSDVLVQAFAIWVLNLNLNRALVLTCKNLPQIISSQIINFWVGPVGGTKTLNKNIQQQWNFCFVLCQLTPLCHWILLVLNSSTQKREEPISSICKGNLFVELLKETCHHEYIST